LPGWANMMSAVVMRAFSYDKQECGLAVSQVTSGEQYPTLVMVTT